MKTKTKTNDRKKAPAIVDAVNFKLQLKPYQHFRLDNGTDVYAIDAGAEEVMSVEWVFFAGNYFEEQNLVAATTNFLLRNGTSKRSAFEINEHFEYYGSYLNRSCFNETATITLHSLTKHIGELLPVVKELITDSVLPPSELAIYQQNMKQRLQVSLKKSDFVAGRLIDVYLFGEQHPYGKYSSFAEFDALKQETLVDFYKKYYQNGKFILFVAGKLPANIEKLLNDSFGDLAQQAMSVPAIPVKQAAEKKYRISNDPAGVQGSIRIARPFPNRHHPDFLKALVLNCLFGGFFGSRLMSNIREEKGYTYGIHSFLLNHINESAWMVSTEAGKDVCEATITEVYKEMGKLREELADEDELLLVKNFMMGSILGDLDGPFQIISRWKNIILNGLNEKYFYESIDTIKSITAKDLQSLAQKYFDPSAFYELVVI
ncbi:MAG TPA: pitrilysin family protein [Chitinophagaceae bacterium]|nr:pitrilysin family protein [Chitinophagaceae bacterium]